MANRFTKFGPWILAASSLAVFFLLLFSLEALVSLKHKGWRLFGPIRFIVLKEHSPGKYFVMRAPKSYLERSDGLADKEFVYHIDANGFIGPFFQGDTFDLTIAFQGGSTTECQAMEEKNRFPYLAARLLESNGARIKSINAAVSGINTLHSINILVNKLLPLKPDIAVYMENVNDQAVLMYQKSYWGNLRPMIVAEKGNPAGELGKAIMKSLMPHIAFEMNRLAGSHASAFDEFAQARGHQVGVDTALLFGEYSKAVETYVAICKANGILPVLMTQASRLAESPDPFMSRFTKPMAAQGLSYGEIRILHRACNQRLRDIAAAHSLPLVDLEASIPQSDLHLYDMVHLNDSGSILAAKLIQQKLQPIADSVINSKRTRQTARVPPRLTVSAH